MDGEQRSIAYVTNTLTPLFDILWHPTGARSVFPLFIKFGGPPKGGGPDPQDPPPPPGSAPAPAHREFIFIVCVCIVSTFGQGIRPIVYCFSVY